MKIMMPPETAAGQKVLIIGLLLVVAGGPIVLLLIYVGRLAWWEAVGATGAALYALGEWGDHRMRAKAKRGHANLLSVWLRLKAEFWEAQATALMALSDGDIGRAEACLSKRKEVLDALERIAPLLDGKTLRTTAYANREPWYDSLQNQTEGWDAPKILAFLRATAAVHPSGLRARLNAPLQERRT